MKQKKSKTRKKTSILKTQIIQNNLMNRFIREIEREEPLNDRTLQSMFVLRQLV